MLCEQSSSSYHHPMSRFEMAGAHQDADYHVQGSTDNGTLCRDQSASGARYRKRSRPPVKVDQAARRGPIKRSLTGAVLQ